LRSSGTKEEDWKVLRNKWEALKVEESCEGLASILPGELTRGISRHYKGLQKLKRILADLDAMELESHHSHDRSQTRYHQQYERFTTRWNFLLSLCLKPAESEDIIGHLEDVFQRDIDRYGEAKARLLYRKNILVSLGPLARWVFHRTVALGILKHYLLRFFN
jgi:hypothetical protein